MLESAQGAILGLTRPCQGCWHGHLGRRSPSLVSPDLRNLHMTGTRLQASRAVRVRRSDQYRSTESGAAQFHVSGFEFVVEPCVIDHSAMHLHRHSQCVGTLCKQSWCCAGPKHWASSHWQSDFRRCVARREAGLRWANQPIHGWGAFAKRPHAVGDMVLEYAGQIVRPIIAELRESRLYDVLVGPPPPLFPLHTASVPLQSSAFFG